MNVQGNGLHEWIAVACVDCADAAPMHRTAVNHRHLPEHVRAFALAHEGHDVRALHGTLHLWFNAADLAADPPAAG
jgi:hypothetical protein